MSFYERFSGQDLEVLRARAERAASAALKTDAEKPVTALQIRCGTEMYALPVDLLRAVYEGIKLVPVPCTPAFVAGIASVRGRILPVLNLATLLGMPVQAADETHALVVVSGRTMTVGFSIETIGEVITFMVHDITPLPGGTDATHTGYLRGVLPDGAGLLDMTAILGDPALVVVETFS